MCSYNETFLEMKHNLLQYQHFIKKHTAIPLENMNIFLFQADIIIFPEDGLTGFEFVNPDYFKPFVQYIPDLDQDIIWNPCLNPSITSNFSHKKLLSFNSAKYGNKSKLLEILSCFALNSKIYLVANMGRNVLRKGKILQFNSDIALDRYYGCKIISKILHHF